MPSWRPGGRPTESSSSSVAMGSQVCGGDFEAHADGQRMTEDLWCELRAYQLVKIDDTWGETTHRAVSRTGTMAPGCSAAFLCAEQRLVQNLTLADTLTSSQRQRFRCLFRSWKVIVQTPPALARKLERPAKVRPRAAFAFAYRFGGAAARSWAALLGEVTLEAVLPAGKTGETTIQRLKQEYLRAVTVTGGVYSAPGIHQTRGCLHGGDVSPGAGERAPRSDDTDIFFMIVDKDISRKKRLRTGTHASALAASFMSVQHMLYWVGCPGECSARGRLAYDGPPRIEEVLDLAHWLSLRMALLRWDSRPSAVAGCIAIDAPTLVQVSADWTDSECPALVLLQALALAGWARGHPECPHTEKSPRVFEIEDPMRDKAYLRCLLGLSQLISERGLPALHPGQTPRYYACVLCAARPADVPLGQSAAQYAALLRNTALAITDTHIDGHSEDEVARPDSSSEEVFMSGHTAKKPARKKAKKAGRTVAWHELVWPGAPPHRAPIADAVQPVHGHQEPPPIADAVGVPEESQLVVAPVAATDGQPLPLYLEGVRVAGDGHGVFGQPGAYRNIRVRCPHHATCGRPGRAFGTKDGLLTRLGDNEPYAYLGCWIRAGSAMDADAHRSWRPSHAQTVAYAAEFGWTPSV